MIPLWASNLARRARALIPIGLPTGFPEEWRAVPTLTVDARGWLQGDGVTHIPIHKSWHYPGLSTTDGEPDAVVWHYTATDAGTAVAMAKRRQQPWSEFAAAYRKSYPGQPVPQNSWHLSIETYGGIVQMAPLTVGCWHAIGTIKGIGAANRVSNGIELVGHGKAFPQAQVVDGARVLRAISEAYDVPRAAAMVEHRTIDPGRRSDPGPVWMSKHAPHVLEYAYRV